MVIRVDTFKVDTNQHPGFARFKAALREEAEGFDAPVVLVYGDAQTFCIDEAIVTVPNFTRVATSESRDVRSEGVLDFRPEVVEENTTL